MTTDFCLQHHRHLQNCVGTRARLGYAAFDAQLQKCVLSLHCMLYIRLCMHKDAYASYVGGLGACHVSSCVQSLWYEYTWFTRAMSGYAQACRHVQHSLAHRTMNRSNCSEVKYSCAGWGSYLVTTTTSVYTRMHQFHNKSACGNVLDHQLASSNLIL